jgi:tRNA A37 threonylcarbamoyladenosine synthetase subunit TsaC/SUA5/YrdC
MADTTLAAGALDFDDSCSPEEADRAYRVICEGGIVLVRSVVGYALMGKTDEAIERMYELKERPLVNPLIVAGNLDLLDKITIPVAPDVRDWLADVITRTTLAVINDMLPSAPLLSQLTPLARSRGTKEGSVALFLNTGWMSETLARKALNDGCILFGTSANASGRGNSYNFTDVPENMRNGADYVLDQGPSLYQSRDRLATTIVDLRRMITTRVGINAPLIMRELKGFDQASRDRGNAPVEGATGVGYRG